MKTKLIISMLILILTTSVISAQNDHNWLVSGSINYKTTEEHFSTEFFGGIAWENVRITLGFESAKDLNYKKYTFPSVDLKMLSLMKGNLLLYMGVETSIIVVKDTNNLALHSGVYTGPDGNFSIGGNASIVLYMTEDVGLYLNTNVYSSEKWNTYGYPPNSVSWDHSLGVVYRFRN